MKQIRNMGDLAVNALLLGLLMMRRIRRQVLDTL